MNFFVKASRWLLRFVALEPRVTSITNNQKQPKTAIAALKAIKKLISAQKRFLHHIIGVLILARQPTRQVVGVVQMWQDTLFETSKLVSVWQLLGRS